MSGAVATDVSARKARDARIDLARGLTMLIIFVAHVPANLWAEFIPARMGFSSGAEAFVLCSGLASGIAFGGTFRREGWSAGARRVARRIGQLWLAQIGSFTAFAVMMLAIGAWLGTDLYRERYALAYAAGNPVDAGFALATLRYIPVYFDILPLYIVLLGAAPFMVALAGFSRTAVLAVSAGLWLVAQVWQVNLPAHPIETRLWYFDPLAWQFLFFLGFGVTARWFTPPAATPGRMVVAAAFIIACIPLTFWGVHDHWPELGSLYRAIYPADAITFLHPLRLLHVLVLGWLFAALLSPLRTNLQTPLLAPLITVGQQALVTFIAGIFLSAIAGVVLDLTGRGVAATAVVNLGGFGLLIATAYIARAAKTALKADKTTVPEMSHARI